MDHLSWDVFEHLVGEWLATVGFTDVRLVGRDPRTAADLYAAHIISAARIQVRFFVEVKRTLKRIDIGVINKVLGAYLNERPNLGWHAALIVTSGGFTDSRRFSRASLSCLGLELRDRKDLIQWLEDYIPTANGLWLLRPARQLPPV